jgi:hypothetical protein
MSSDPRQGGRLEDMAVDGTTIPSSSAQPRYIKSVPRPDQIVEDPNSLGQSGLDRAADNVTDMPRRNKDMGATGEVITGTGDQLPAQIESKRLHYGPNNPLAKGHDRYDKHARQNESDLDRFAGDGAEVDEAPGDEGDDQDTIRSRKGLQGEGGIL